MNIRGQFTRNKILLIAFIILLILNLTLTFSIFNLKKDYQNYVDEAIKKKDTNFTLLSPDIAYLDVNEFLTVREKLTTSYTKLKNELNETITKNVTGKFGLYFEDLSTGAWIGLNEKDKFLPASLMKVTIMIAILKKVEKGELTLDQTVSLSKESLDDRSGTLYLKGEGAIVTIKELLEYLIKSSDNTAARTFTEILTVDEYKEALSAVGFNTAELDAASPKDYGNLLRSLYYSTYLRRTFSEMGLSIMAQTNFDSQIPKGLNSSIMVAHKVGYYLEGGYWHDCGIVYYPNSPYMLCVMSKDTTREEADRVIKEISKTIFEFKSEKSNFG